MRGGCLSHPLSQIIQTGKHTFVVELTLWPMVGGMSAVNALVPKELLSGERLISVCPVIFSRGINEMQAISNMNIFAKLYELHVCGAGVGVVLFSSLFLCVLPVVFGRPWSVGCLVFAVVAWGSACAVFAQAAYRAFFRGVCVRRQFVTRAKSTTRTYRRCRCTTRASVSTTEAKLKP
jgi:hypothetical protein